MRDHTLLSQELEELHINVLAVLCQKIADCGDATTPEVEEALQLKREWALLIGQPRSPAELKSHDDTERYAEPLKQRMLNFLFRCSATVDTGDQVT